MKHKKDGEEYLMMYPEFKKWINECPVCHSKGYKSDMPERIGREYSVAAKTIRKCFNSLEVDEDGFCLHCAKLMH